MIRRSLHCFSIIILCLGFALSGCSGGTPKTGTLVGGTAGGVAGGVLGHTVGGGSGLATIAGVVLGAAVGSYIGSRMDQSDRQYVSQALETNQTG